MKAAKKFLAWVTFEFLIMSFSLADDEMFSVMAAAGTFSSIVCVSKLCNHDGRLK